MQVVKAHEFLQAVQRIEILTSSKAAAGKRFSWPGERRMPWEVMDGAIKDIRFVVDFVETGTRTF